MSIEDISLPLGLHSPSLYLSIHSSISKESYKVKPDSHSATMTLKKWFLWGFNAASISGSLASWANYGKAKIFLPSFIFKPLKRVISTHCLHFYFLSDPSLSGFPHSNRYYYTYSSDAPFKFSLLDLHHIFPWSRKWHCTLVFLPGKSHGQRILMGYSPWARHHSRPSTSNLPASLIALPAKYRQNMTNSHHVHSYHLIQATWLIAIILFFCFICGSAQPVLNTASEGTLSHKSDHVSLLPMAPYLLQRENQCPLNIPPGPGDLLVLLLWPNGSPPPFSTWATRAPCLFFKPFSHIPPQGLCNALPWYPHAHSPASFRTLLTFSMRPSQPYYTMWQLFTKALPLLVLLDSSLQHVSPTPIPCSLCCLLPHPLWGLPW